MNYISIKHCVVSIHSFVFSKCLLHTMYTFIIYYMFYSFRFVIFFSVYLNVSSSMQRSFFIHIYIVLLYFRALAFMQRGKICAMFSLCSFGLSRWSRIFCNRCWLGYSYHVRAMCIVLHLFNNVEFICNSFSLTISLPHLTHIACLFAILQTLQLFFATSLNGHDTLLIASNASIQWAFILLLHQKFTIETILMDTLRAEISTDTLYKMELWMIWKKNMKHLV